VAQPVVRYVTGDNDRLIVSEELFEAQGRHLDGSKCGMGPSATNRCPGAGRHLTRPPMLGWRWRVPVPLTASPRANRLAILVLSVSGYPVGVSTKPLLLDRGLQVDVVVPGQQQGVAEHVRKLSPESLLQLLRRAAPLAGSSTEHQEGLGQLTDLLLEFEQEPRGARLDPVAQGVDLRDRLYLIGQSVEIHLITLGRRYRACEPGPAASTGSASSTPPAATNSRLSSHGARVLAPRHSISQFMAELKHPPVAGCHSPACRPLVT
jgi:hypothetical protein